MQRSVMREFAFKLIYGLEVQKENTQEQIDLFIEANNIENEIAIDYLNDIVKGLNEKNEEIENLITKNLKQNWSINRVSKINVSLIKIAIYEMLYKNVPYKVAINEVVELAKKYADDSAPVFINGILATNSVGFALVQVLCLAIGIGIYIPFVLLDNAVSKRVNHEMGIELEEYLINCEKNVIEPQIFNLNNHLELHAENVLLHLESNIKNGFVDLTYHPQVKNNKIISRRQYSNNLHKSQYPIDKQQPLGRSTKRRPLLGEHKHYCYYRNCHNCYCTYPTKKKHQRQESYTSV